VVGSSNSFVFEATSYVLIQFFHNPPPAGAKQLQQILQTLSSKEPGYTGSLFGTSKKMALSKRTLS